MYQSWDSRFFAQHVTPIWQRGSACFVLRYREKYPRFFGSDFQLGVHLPARSRSNWSARSWILLCWPGCLIGACFCDEEFDLKFGTVRSGGCQTRDKLQLMGCDFLRLEPGWLAVVWTFRLALSLIDIWRLLVDRLRGDIQFKRQRSWGMDFSSSWASFILSIGSSKSRVSSSAVVSSNISSSSS